MQTKLRAFVFFSCLWDVRSFLVQGLKELKLFKADAARHRKMNESGEDFRRITMKVLVMQLANTTIMDLVTYGGAGLGVAMTILSVTEWGLSPVMARKNV